MLKKTALLMLAAFFIAGFVFAQEEEIPEVEQQKENKPVSAADTSPSALQVTYSVEAKTGLYWEISEFSNRTKPEQDDEVVKIGINDESPHNVPGIDVPGGRLRLNMHLYNSNLNLGAMIRFQQHGFTTAGVAWDYAFGYANFFNEQIRLSIGKLGESPWSAGGPDILDELDKAIGIRAEFMPKFIQGINIGFVLNGYGGFHEYNPTENNEKDTLLDMMKETVLGISYTNAYFHGRFSFRGDGESDYDRNFDEQRGMEIMYRLEERAIGKLLPGFQIFANGWFRGLGVDENILKSDSDSKRINQEFMNYNNFLYILYAPEILEAQVRLGMEMFYKRQIFKARASFYYNFFPWLSAGAAFEYENEMGEIRTVINVPFYHIGVEPQIRINFNSNAYLAFIYSYSQSYQRNIADPGNAILKTTNKFNMRTVFSF